MNESTKVSTKELSKEYWVKKLGLLPHPEGGFYKQTFCSNNMVTIPGKFEKPHSTGTDIYFLLGSPSIGDFSAWHTLNDLEESWHFHYGSDVLIYIIDSKGNLTEKRLGIGENAELQVHIPAKTWFCAVVDSDNPNDYSLVGCAVYPGFDFNDFELGNEKSLSQKYPLHKELIQKYARKEIEIEKKLSANIVDKLSHVDIFQTCLTLLQSFDSISSSPSFVLTSSNTNSPEKVLKEKLRDINNLPDSTNKKEKMIEEIEKSSIDLDRFSRIYHELKEKNNEKTPKKTSVFTI